MNLSLSRSLALFDLETTGLDPASDRIVEIAVLRIDPDGGRERFRRLLDPGRPIPPEASAVHGIRDADVRGQPRFADIRDELLAFLRDSDLGGFGVARFDLPLLEREVREAGGDLRLAERRVVDVLTIFHRKERRDLSAALRFYCGREHDGAHGAAADVEATADVLEAQLERYAELPRDTAGLDAWCNPAPPGAVDRAGKFVWKGREVVFAFGKNQGRTLREVASSDRGYLEWIARSDFPEDARRVVREALAGRLPDPPDQST